MHGYATYRKDHEALRRLAVVLLALAAIAEGVGRHAAPVRCLVLWLLCRAEARVRDLAFRIGGCSALASMSAGSPALVGSGEAPRLVQSFRVLAAVFFALARQAPQWLRMCRHDSACLSANRRNSVGPGRRSGERYMSFADTS